jgi:hypothetical protein
MPFFDVGVGLAARFDALDEVIQVGAVTLAAAAEGTGFIILTENLPAVRA